MQLVNKYAERKKKERMTTLRRDGNGLKLEPGKARMLAICYCPPISDRIRKVAKKKGINAYEENKGTLGDLLINLKDPRLPKQKSGIYEIKCGCDKCPKKYCGQTRRRAAARWKEHEAAFRLERKRESAIADHCMAKEHPLGEKRILKEVSNPILLNSWESFYIQTGENLVNRDDAPIKSKLYDEASKQSMR